MANNKIDSSIIENNSIIAIANRIKREDEFHEAEIMQRFNSIRLFERGSGSDIFSSCSREGPVERESPFLSEYWQVSHLLATNHKALEIAFLIKDKRTLSLLDLITSLDITKETLHPLVEKMQEIGCIDYHNDQYALSTKGYEIISNLDQYLKQGDNQ